MATLSPSEFTYQKDHIGDDRRVGIAVSNGVCYGLALVAVLLRAFSRHLARSNYRADDWWICGALLLFTIYIAAYQVMVHFGMGRHTLLVTNFKAFVVASIFAAITYNLTIAAIKLSIIYFYHRIFPQRWFKQALIGTAAIVIGTAIAQLPFDIVQCVPIKSQWDPNVKGKCVHFGKFIFGVGISNIVTDIILLLLPMSSLWKLKVSASQRRLLISLFLLGGFACIVSFVRVFFVQQWKGPDPAWNDVNTAELSTVELGVGIFSACLPAYRPLFNLCFHGEVTHSGAKGRSKAYIKSSSERRAIRMADIRRGWYGNGEALGSGDEEQIHTAFVTAPNAQGDKNFRQHSESDNRILVTREFDTESFSAR